MKRSTAIMCMGALAAMATIAIAALQQVYVHQLRTSHRPSGFSHGSSSEHDPLNMFGAAHSPDGSAATTTTTTTTVAPTTSPSPPADRARVHGGENRLIGTAPAPVLASSTLAGRAPAQITAASVPPVSPSPVPTRPTPQQQPFIVLLSGHLRTFCVSAASLAAFFAKDPRFHGRPHYVFLHTWTEIESSEVTWWKKAGPPPPVRGSVTRLAPNCGLIYMVLRGDVGCRSIRAGSDTT